MVARFVPGAWRSRDTATRRTIAGFAPVCPSRTRLAAFTRIDLVYLPPYSPHLNLIERVWKFVKKAALANRSFPDYPAFRAAIDGTLNRLGTTHRDAMASLLTLRFETLHTVSNSTA